MDPTTILTYLVGIIPMQDLIYLAALCGVCAALMPWLPVPTSKGSVYGRAYSALNLLAQNFRNVANKAQPEATQTVRVEAADGDRRKLLGYALMTPAAIAAMGSLSACTVTTSGNVTTITINVAKVKAYGTAGINAVTTILSIAAVASAIGTPAVAMIETAAAALTASLAAFSTAAGSSVTVSYDDTSFQTAINSMLADLQTVATDLDGAITGAESKVASSDLSTATTALDALKTIVSVFEGLLSVSAVRRAKLRPVRTTLTEAQALAILHVVP